MADDAKKAVLTFGGKTLDMPVKSGSIGPMSSTSPSSTRRPAPSPSIRASPRPRPASRRSPISTVTKAFCSTAAIRSNSSPRTATSSRPATCSITVNCRHQAQRKEFDKNITYHTMVHEQMTRFFPGLPPRCASDGGDGRRGRRHVGVLSRLDRHQRSAPARDRFAPDDRQAADDRGHGLQVSHRPALRLSAN